MGVQRVPIALVLLAGLGDAASAHRLAFYSLVLAVPAISVAALGTLASALDRGDPRAIGRAWAQALALVLVLVSAAARAPAGAGGVPRLATSALVACLLLFACQGALALVPALRRRLHGRVPERGLTRI